MALILYHDAAATEPVNDQNPIRVEQPVSPGGAVVDERIVYVKSDNALLAYEGVNIGSRETDRKPESSRAVMTLEFALDDNGTPGAYSPALQLPDGDYQTAFPVWRRERTPNIEGAHLLSGKHDLDWTEYIAG